MNNLHPAFAAALAPFAPPSSFTDEQLLEADRHLADEADEARRTIVAPEMRPVGQVPCVPTSTGVLIGCAYRRPMPQPSADAERIQAALLAKPARRPSDGWAFWLILAACVLVFALFSGCTGPTDPEADADSALNLQDAVAAAVVAASARK